MSTLKTTNLQNASATSPAFVLAADGSATANLSSVNGGALSGTRNRILNGDMRIDQRNAGASVTPTTDAFTVDRWRFQTSQSSKLSFQQNAGSVTPPAGFSSYLGATSLSAYSITSSDIFVIGQSIEGFNTVDLAWGTASAKAITISFWVRSSLTGTFGGVVKNATPNRSYPFTYSISSANTWEQKTVNVTGDTTGTWVADNGKGLQIVFGLGNGSTQSGAAGSWAAADYWSATGATSVVGTSGATFYITGVQLEPGSTATPFERRSYGQELALCQRYYSKSFAASLAGPVAADYTGNMGWGQSVEAAAVSISVRFPVEMRATPTVTIYSPTSATAGTFRVWQAGVDRTGSAGHISSSGFARIDKSGAADLSGSSTQTSAIHWVASIEL